jgi:SAM-dependent methyltransferase
MIINDRTYFYKLIDENNFKICAEIGVQSGEFSEKLLKSKVLNKLYLIDCWTYQYNYIDIANIEDEQQKILYEYVLKKFEGEPRVSIIKKFSNQACNLFENDSFDFIYIDADHSYEAVKNDINIWYDKLKDGGILAGHDYVNGLLPEGEFGVKQAVDEFVKEYNKTLYLTNEDNWKSWYFRK